MDKIKPRIITGKYKGKRLKVSEDSRPLTDRVKTMIFDLIGDSIENITILDTFAGSGNFGIEALSRGASHATFIEISDYAFQILKENLADCKVPEEDYKIAHDNYLRFLRKSDQLFDLIFVDPPFHMSSKVDFKDLKKNLSKNGFIVAKLPSDFEKYLLKKHFEIIYEKIVGKNSIYFLKPTK